MEYQVSRDDTMFGPYTEAELRQYSVSGNIVMTDLVRRAGTEKWTPLKKVLKQLDDRNKRIEAREKKSKALRMEGLRPASPRRRTCRGGSRPSWMLRPASPSSSRGTLWKVSGCIASTAPARRCGTTWWRARCSR